MKILHYFLGFPPYRTGGMTNFAYDLMNSQKENNEVIALWPGRMSFINSNKVKIRKVNNNNDICNYEIINPLPIPLDEGIKEVYQYTKKADINIFYNFLKDISPNVIHIHTLMGLHKEFIEACKMLKIKTVFTTHDYFGICPKVTLYRYGEVCDKDFECKECVRCNYSALSINKIKIMQSGVYRFLKNSKFVKLLRKRHRQNFFNEKLPNFMDENNLYEKQKEYQFLRNYYVWILENIDVIHFNSTLAKEIYLKYINPKAYEVISISHKNISDNRKNKHIENNKIRFTFLASTKPYKGFYILKEALDEIYNEKIYEFELNVYSNVNEKYRSEYMNVYENGFNQDEFSDIFSKTDVLIAPSIWYETFGFTVLEALSYGVPVIVTDRVGAKDIVNDCGIIVPATSYKQLKNAIVGLNKDVVSEYRNKIKKAKLKIWIEFCMEIERLYIK